MGHRVAEIPVLKFVHQVGRNGRKSTVQSFFYKIAVHTPGTTWTVWLCMMECGGQRNIFRVSGYFVFRADLVMGVQGCTPHAICGFQNQRYSIAK